MNRKHIYTREYFERTAKDKIDKKAREKCFKLSLPHKNMKILEIGAGDGELMTNLEISGAKVWGIEYSKEMCKLMNMPRLICGNAIDENIYPKVKFDRVIICNTLEHFYPEEINKLIPILIKIIKPNGLLVIGNESHPTKFHFKGHYHEGEHNIRISDTFFNILIGAISDWFKIKYRNKGYLVLERNSNKTEAKIDLSEYGTGEYLGLEPWEIPKYWLEKRYYFLRVLLGLNKK